MEKNRDKAEPEIQMENDSIRVTKYYFSPGAETGFHEHFLGLCGCYSD